jgi:hypothetical protein
MISDSRQKYIELELRRNPTFAILDGRVRNSDQSDAGVKTDSEFGMIPSQ